MIWFGKHDSPSRYQITCAILTQAAPSRHAIPQGKPAGTTRLCARSMPSIVDERHRRRFRREVADRNIRHAGDGKLCFVPHDETRAYARMSLQTTLPSVVAELRLRGHPPSFRRGPSTRQGTEIIVCCEPVMANPDGHRRVESWSSAASPRRQAIEHQHGRRQCSASRYGSVSAESDSPFGFAISR